MSPSITSRLQFQHQTIPEIIRGYTEEQLRIRVIPDKWSILENMAHLTRYQEVFLERIGIISTGSKPMFERYVAENDPGFEIFVQKSLSELSERLVTVRADIYKSLTGLTENQLSQVGVHPKFGALSIIQWTEFFLLHEAHHLFTMFKLGAEFLNKK